MRTIAIVLGDNDFGNTFRPLLEGLKRAIAWRSPEELSKQDTELIIRRSIPAYYLGYQHRFDLESIDLCRMDKLEMYLNEAKVLFDEEAERDIATGDHDGGAWYLEIQSGTISGY